MTSVGFEWKMIPSARIEGYMLYRLDPGSRDGKLKRVATISDRYSSHYVDENLKPGSLYIYQMSTYTSDGFESLQSEPVRVKTAPMVPSVSFLRAIANLPERIKLIWRPHQDMRVTGYVIERTTVAEPGKWQEIAEVQNRLSAEYIDRQIKQEEVYVYRVRVKLCNGLVSGPSTAVKAITKPLPKPPLHLTATQDLPRSIHLEWQPSPTPDVVYYKVYRSPFANAFYIYRAKTDKTFFDDRVDDDGKIYYYKVSAVDKDGLESPIPDVPVMGSTLTRPSPPTITAAKTAFSQGIIIWEPGDDRAEKYDVIRTHWEGLSRETRTFTNIYGNKFVDKFMKPGIKYTYRVVEIDRNGLRSEPSEAVELYIEPGRR
ncbi:putative fibronectin domain-containing lipoprotein [Hydrogenimonas sp.]|nr:putative fibronectin domain-containing lipoprotein [Hydrogenimonas sp.]